MPQPATRFQAEIGIDNNADTRGKHGSVRFAVVVAGERAFQSDVLRGGQEPVAVDVQLNAATEFTLHVTDGGDGPSHDQADWADARVTLADGTELWLDQLPRAARATRLGTDLPFSFVYDGKPSAELLAAWKRSQKEEQSEAGMRRQTLTYSDPKTGLEVTCELTSFTDSSAADWVLRFRNTGVADTPVIEKILPLDLRIEAADPEPITFHHSHGSTNAATDFVPMDEPVSPGKQIRLAPNGGRSSDGHLPFFNLQWKGGGLVAAVGWSGQWQLDLSRGGPLVLQAGQQTARFKLHSGESVRTPRILLIPWEGDDSLLGNNQLRRLLLAHYVPRHDGKIILPPVGQPAWVSPSDLNSVTEANQLQAIGAKLAKGAEAYWLDAGWFEGGWPSGVGNWVARSDAFPNGLKPLGDAARQRGLKFVLWYEPERVSPDSRIAKQHPEWVMHDGPGDGMFNLGNDAARAWMTNLISAEIKRSGVTIYRHDCNLEPLRFWTAADAPDRKGISEIRHVEGLYQMWDELRRRHPGLLVDNCASGGRRIDLETTSRSIPLWRSDTQVGPAARPVWDQCQSAGLSLYIPLHTAGAWSFDPYLFRSVATTGTVLCMGTGGGEAQSPLGDRMIDELKTLRELYLGDYYPLLPLGLPIGLAEDQWCGWQFDRPEMGRGFVMCFRRQDSPYVALGARLRGLEATAKYEVRDIDAGTTRTLSGKELMSLRIEVPAAPGSALVTYRKLGE